MINKDCPTTDPTAIQKHIHDRPKAAELSECHPISNALHTLCDELNRSGGGGGKHAFLEPRGQCVQSRGCETRSPTVQDLSAAVRRGMWSRAPRLRETVEFKLTPWGAADSDSDGNFADGKPYSLHQLMSPSSIPPDICPLTVACQHQKPGYLSMPLTKVHS